MISSSSHASSLVGLGDPRYRDEAVEPKDEDRDIGTRPLRMPSISSCSKLMGIGLLIAGAAPLPPSASCSREPRLLIVELQREVKVK